MCGTIRTDVFTTTASKVNKAVTKSSSNFDIVEVYDGMNIPPWFRDFIPGIPEGLGKTRARQHAMHPPAKGGGIKSSSDQVHSRKDVLVQ